MAVGELFVFQTNVGERVKEKKFIRTLATTIFENSIVKNKLNQETLKNHYNLFHRFVDNNPEFELQCLFALQALSCKLSHPPGKHDQFVVFFEIISFVVSGLLLSICTKLYEDLVFSQDSFNQWEVSDDPSEQQDKGQCFYFEL